MAISAKRQRRLWEAYAFPGFRPQGTVRGVFGDPEARVITLVRRSKKRSAAVADEHAGAGTTGARVARAICPAAMRASTSNSRCDAYSASAAAQ